MSLAAVCLGPKEGYAFLKVEDWSLPNLSGLIKNKEQLAAAKWMPTSKVISFDTSLNSTLKVFWY